MVFGLRALFGATRHRAIQRASHRSQCFASEVNTEQNMKQWMVTHADKKSQRPHASLRTGITQRTNHATNTITHVSPRQYHATNGSETQSDDKTDVLVTWISANGCLSFSRHDCYHQNVDEIFHDALPKSLTRHPAHEAPDRVTSTVSSMTRGTELSTICSAMRSKACSDERT